MCILCMKLNRGKYILNLIITKKKIKNNRNKQKNEFFFRRPANEAGLLNILTFLLLF